MDCTVSAGVRPESPTSPVSSSPLSSLSRRDGNSLAQPLLIYLHFLPHSSGGKVSFLAGTHADLFKGVAIVHPAMLDVNDVKDLAVPLALFPSKVRILSSASALLVDPADVLGG